MIPLPQDAQAHIARILADLELAVMAAYREPPPNLDGVFLLHAPIQPLVLKALGEIVAVISALPWTATERRQTVTQYQNDLLTLYALTPARFLEALRKQSWWGTFQETLREAERTDIPSFGQQLKQAMIEARVSVEWLVTATDQANTPINKRTIERVKADERLPRIDTVRALEAALTKARNGVPMQFVLPTTPQHRRKKSQPSRKRSQNAAKRR